MTPGVEQLEIGQRFMRIFELVEFESGSDLTLRIVRGENGFGNLAVTYRVVPTSGQSCRLVVKIAVTGGFGRLPDRLAPALDLFMMRKQLITLKKLSEADAGAQPELSFIDERCTEVAATPVDVWRSFESVIGRAMGDGTVKRAYARLIGCRETERTGSGLEPGSTLVGFRIAQSNPPRRLVLEGRHRASGYELGFEVRPSGEGSKVCARTSADFPGLFGRIYRVAVIGTGAHKLATRSLLAAIKRRAEHRSANHDL